MKDGDIVRIKYTGWIKETGELFDTTDEKTAKEEGIHSDKMKYGSIPAIVNAGKLVKGLEKTLKKMKVGEEKEVEIGAEEGFGKRKPELIKLIPEMQFKKQNMSPHPGMVVSMNNLRGRIISANSGRIRVDFNHPLAGKKLFYRIKIEKKVEDTKEKAENIGEFYLGDKPTVEVKENKGKMFIPQGLNDKMKNEIKETVRKYTELKDLEFEEKGNF